MLHGRRQRIRDAEDAEAKGESLWTEAFSSEARVRIEAITVLGSGPYDEAEAAGAIHRLISEELGVDLWDRYAEHRGFDLRVAILGRADDVVMPSLLEALYLVAKALNHGSAFEQKLNVILYEHRIAYKMTEGQMHPFSSLEMHQAVVEPALRLLSGKPGWDKVESAYQDALKEIGDGNAADAITDAARALQEALTLLGLSGNTLGKLATSARKEGFLGPHDSLLADGIGKLIDWVSADRSEKGEAHKTPSTSRDDAWLAVHVVGALILRLAEGPRTEAG